MPLLTYMASRLSPRQNGKKERADRPAQPRKRTPHTAHGIAALVVNWRAYRAHGTRGNAVHSPPPAAAFRTCPPPAPPRPGAATAGFRGGRELGLRLLPLAPGGAGRTGPPPPQLRSPRPPRRRLLRRAHGARRHRHRRQRRGP